MKPEERKAYYRAAADRWIEGIRLQAARCAGSHDREGFFDCNFLVVVVARLIEVARMAQQKLQVPELAQAVESFNKAHPEFRDVRDFQEHILDPSLIGTALYFAGGRLVRLNGDGGAETLIDPARLTLDAEKLYESLCQLLGSPPPPKDMLKIRPPKKRRAGPQQ